MRIAFLDFVLLLFALYLITQIFLPLLLPKKLKTNWLFKKTNTDKVKTLINEKERIKSDAAEIIGKTEQELADAKKNRDTLKKLTK